MPRASRPGRTRYPQPVPLHQPPIRGMRLNASEVPGDPTLAHYLVNGRPVDPVNGGPVVARPPMNRLGSVAYGGATLFAQFTKSDGTYLSVMLKSGEIYTYTWSSSTWTKVVAAGVFTAASVTVSTTAPAYAVQFGDRLVVSDGTNTPWYWDGTTSGGITGLTNCPVLYGQPVVYYAKLFGIKNADRTTIVWSEENDPATGYEAAGYNNAWALTQTDSKPLVALAGTNDGLYYFRERSIGVIRGAVTSDFRTTGVHDGVSTTVGVVAPGAVAAAGQDLWFMDVNQRPHVLTGGEVVDCAADTGPAVASGDPYEEPFGLALVHWLRAITQPSWLARIRCLVVPSMVDLPRAQVYFAIPTSESGQVDESGAWLVYDAETRLPQAFYTVPKPASSFGTSINAAAVLFRDTTATWALTWVGTPTASVPMHLADSFISQKDHDSTGTTTAAFAWRLVGPALAHEDALELQLDRLDLVMSGTGTGAPTPAIRLLTSTAAHSDSLPTALSPTLTAPGTGVVSTQKATVGLSQVGRWARLVLDLTWSSGTRFGLQSYTLWVIPTTTSPYVP